MLINSIILARPSSSFYFIFLRLVHTNMQNSHVIYQQKAVTVDLHSAVAVLTLTILIPVFMFLFSFYTCYLLAHYTH